jgi:hypothetical protein
MRHIATFLYSGGNLTLILLTRQGVTCGASGGILPVIVVETFKILQPELVVTLTRAGQTDATIEIQQTAVRVTGRLNSMV